MNKAGNFDTMCFIKVYFFFLMAKNVKKKVNNY